MYKKNKNLFFSPSDLTLFLDSPFASWMERAKIEQSDFSIQPDGDDPFMALLAEKGIAHENDLLNKLIDQKLSVFDIEAQENSDKISATLDAMQQGFDIIYQASLTLNDVPEESTFYQFIGHADYLKKIPIPSQLGDYSYEVWDAKLASHVKPYFIIQLCCYAQMLEKIQGIRPVEIVVVLGNNKIERLTTNDYFYYYRNIKDQFLKFHQNFNLKTMEDPANSKEFGQWSDYANRLLIEHDDLSLTANITRAQIKKLGQKNINTCEDLMNSTLETVPKIHNDTYQRLKNQTTIQIKSRGLEKPLYKVIGVRLGLLPPHSDYDVFFDIEGFPLVEGGLEYLWGNTYFDESQNRQFVDFWAHDQAQEKSAFIEFIHWVYARWKIDPNMHIYHYGHYEITACRKLMGRYGVCEYEVDQLLRNEVFVDLYKITRSGLLIGEPSYSIKNVEHLYREKRDTEVGDGGDSVVVYEAWRVKHDGETWQTSEILKNIRDYNKDDCDSTQELTQWLRLRQAENELDYMGKILTETEESEELTERISLRNRLLLQSEQELEKYPDKATLTENLAWVLEFHRREAKPFFWRLFDRIGMSHEELFDDLDCIAFCKRTSRPAYKRTERARTYCYEYQFDINQELRSINYKYWYLMGGDGSKVALELEECDFYESLLVVRTNIELDDVISLIPDTLVRPKPIPESIEQVVALYETLTNSEKPQAPRGAIYDFLNRSIPNISHRSEHQKNNHSIVNSNEAQVRLNEIITAVTNLDQSYLAIQGPPGTGKTYTGARIIAHLVSLGKKIAVTSNSHKAINNLLLATAKYLKETDKVAKLLCSQITENKLVDYGVNDLPNNLLADEVEAGCVIGTTAWGFSRDDMANQFDYLFVDEAGQVSVANLIAMSRCCDNLVLMGDQMQLGQPIQGSHPKESGLSVLDYLLHDQATINKAIGVFLNTSYRMHSTINQFISDAVYEGKLIPDADNDRQIIAVPDDYSGVLNKEAGILFVPVSHDGNTQSSNKEVLMIKKLSKELIGRVHTNKNRENKPVSIDDILVIAPYNHQVNLLQKALGEKAKVGTIDKFQGQEAPIVLLSLCASDANESPRGINFLFNTNRINVAVSRAQSLVVIVGHPDLVSTRANTTEQMKKINVFAHLIDHTKSLDNL